MQHHVQNYSKLFIIGIIGAALFGSGLVMGATLGGSNYAAGGKVESALLREVKDTLDTKFVFWKASSTLPTDKDFEYGMIKGYVDSYKDPYTVFFPPREAKSFTENVQGSFGGVGMNVGTKEGNIVVIAPLKDSPAMKAGVQAGDIILSVDGTSIAGLSSDEAVSMIRGEVGTKVTISIYRADTKENKDITITRDTIKIPTLDTKVENGVYIIQLYNFSAESPELFRDALNTFIASNLNHLIIDLRGNPGGYLDAAVEMASFFLPEGSVVVSEKQGKLQTTVNHRSTGTAGVPDKTNIVVLVDNGSASASEILAGALKDAKVATVVGEKTFGKGSVQELINLSGGAALKVTTAKWYTPNGTSISEHGIVPDVESLAATSSPKLGKDGKPIDTQLLKAIEVVKQRK